MKRVALVVGHSKSSQGAMSKPFNLSEYKYNSTLAAIVKMLFNKEEINVKIFERRTTIQEVTKDVNLWNPDAIIEFHCNSYDTKVGGREALYWHLSGRGCLLAGLLLKNLGSVPGIGKDRGCVPLIRGNRGWYLLAKTKAPCVILEPFFIDNFEECSNALYYITKIAVYIHLSIKEFLNATNK